MKNQKNNKKINTVWKYSIISFLALVLISLGISSFLDTENSIISILESLATAITAAAVFGAAYFAYKELSEIESSRYLDVADRLFCELNSSQNIEARRHIFQNLPEYSAERKENLKKEDRNAMKRVLNSLDRVAFLTQEDWIPVNLIMPWMHPMIAKSWEKLEPYVLYERKLRNEPYYYEHASELAKHCENWRQDNLTEEERNNKWDNNAL